MVERRRPKTPASFDYKVGYGKPPRHTRFKPGQSGNPKGRSKGLRNFKTDIQEVLRTPIDATIGGKKRKISSQFATLLKLVRRALDGDVRALGLLLSLAQTYNAEEPATPISGTSDNDLELLRVFEDRVLRKATERLGARAEVNGRPARAAPARHGESDRGPRKHPSVPRVRSRRTTHKEDR